MKMYKKNGDYTKAYIDMMRRYYARYVNSNNTSLYQCYKKPSETKLGALNRIRYKADSPVLIISYNTSFFIVAYFEALDNEQYFVVDTGRNVYKILEEYL